MSFFNVVLAYLLSRHTSLPTWLQQDGWFDRLLATLAQRHPGTPVALWLLVPGCSVLVATLVAACAFWPALLLSLAILLYSLGRGSWWRDCPVMLERLQQGRAEQVWLLLESEGTIETRSDTLWMALRRHVAYRYLQDLFAIFCWFCLLGPAGALGYRLLDHYNRQADARQLPPAALWQRAMEWLPARYMGLCFCLAGDFTRCFWVWRELFFDTQLDAREFLCRCLDAALVFDAGQARPAASPEEEQIEEALRYGPSLDELLQRTEIIGLVGLALVVLVFT